MVYQVGTLNIKTSILYNGADLIRIIDAGQASVRHKLSDIKMRGSSVSIADMFDMQMMMNHLAQLTEMSSSLVAAANSSFMSLARNMKG